ncbi:carboxypeptidase-like regulatory domain-containing protein [Algoriphagus limi]|uniref:Carboxypeptidase-like regulatory domain-containing protein n=1 Tax=Algoriphagus limi TaxID=2975273 RepID=A0ABT2G707_9BACT|nr:carboxypeptidase-like regulatory domain-containing protein [Algoriphagus limi]MCS5490553.1 carboxypeptidase-like regulatory domain-containing protein [Algoriphagus limi]
MKDKIYIPKPCSENPKNFTKTPNGGFCRNCQKEVVDFREKDNREILTFLSKNPSKQCGIFSPNQIPIHESPNRKVKFQSIWAFGLLGLLGFSLPAFAQAPIPHSFEQSPSKENLILKTDTSSLYKRTIKGKAVSKYFNDIQPLPGATISIKNYTIGTTTDLDGYFELEVPDSVKDQKIILMLSFVGYKMREVIIYDTQLPVQLGEIELYEDQTILMGEIIYIKQTFWQKIKQVFKSKKPQKCADPNHQHT